jgi:hypothetical protein
MLPTPHSFCQGRRALFDISLRHTLGKKKKEQKEQNNIISDIMYVEQMSQTRGRTPAKDSTFLALGLLWIA